MKWLSFYLRFDLCNTGWNITMIPLQFMSLRGLDIYPLKTSKRFRTLGHSRLICLGFWRRPEFWWFKSTFYFKEVDRHSKGRIKRINRFKYQFTRKAFLQPFPCICRFARRLGNLGNWYTRWPNPEWIGSFPIQPIQKR